MKVLKVLGGLIILLLIAAISYFFYLKSSLTPTYEGTVALAGIESEVEIYFTEYGIPHIYAESETEAYLALGYIHAMERLWQMDLLRHVGSGTLSELFGPDMIENDKYLRTIGLNTYAEESAKEYQTRNDETLPMVQAYIDGINAYIKSNTKPLEYHILGLEVEPFEIQNIFETLTYMSFSFSNAQITDPVLTELYQKLDSSYLKDLQLYHYKGESVLRSFDDRYSTQSKIASAITIKLGVPEFIGSNSWVLAPEKTKNKQVILANDPHIGFAQPAVWYESHLTFPDNEYYGYHIPGAPFPLLMHSERHATGVTMFENDDMDFYVEEIHPEDSNTYRHDGEWKSITSRKEEIMVKGGESVTFFVRSTVHGPIVSDILKDEPLEDVVSMYWVTSNHPNYMLEAIYGFINAQNLGEIEKASALIHGPGLNIMYGDASGNIAWWASAKLPVRANEQTSKTFYDGASGTEDRTDFYSFDKNPHAINPPWGYVHSANNQPDTVDGVLYSGYYLQDDRGERITEILNSAAGLDTDYMKNMLLDDKSMAHQTIQETLMDAIADFPNEELIADLKDWDQTFDREDFRPLIFQKWLHEIIRLATQDEIGLDLWEMYKKTHTYKVSAEHLIMNDDSKWWDNIETDPIESREQIISFAFDSTFYQLQQQWGEDYTTWKWGNAHKLNHKHAMGDVLNFLNVGSFPVSGGNEVLNNMGYTYENTQEQIIRFGPSTRRIVDFSDVRNNSWSILPTGQSGVLFSPHYSDQAQMFAEGEFRKMNMNHGEIKQSKNLLVLTPQN